MAEPRNRRLWRVDAAIHWLRRDPATLARGLAVLNGAIAVLCSAMVYVDTLREFWRAERTFIRFFGTVTVAGLGWFSAIATVPVVLGLLVEASNVGGKDARATSMLWRRLAPLTGARFGLALAGLTLLVFGSPVIGLGLILVGELCGRALFFRAVTAPKTVGALS